MSAAFEALGRPLPPWRSVDMVLAKWQPKRFTDVAIRDDLHSAGAVGSGGGGEEGEDGPALQELRRSMAALGV